MTHGEAYVQEKNSMHLENGVWKKEYIPDKPKPMSREDASKYYNTKLHDYWLDMLNKERPKRKKKNSTWIKIRMFGTPQNAKLLGV
ncbi:MAG: hypothetical protein Q9M40_07245 [Sulfurimonas sp.]|nr:hypothetical protein [Sulfurimonas sp.]